VTCHHDDMMTKAHVRPTRSKPERLIPIGIVCESTPSDWLSCTSSKTTIAFVG
jgi:hypothetical protein